MKDDPVVHHTPSAPMALATALSMFVTRVPGDDDRRLAVGLNIDAMEGSIEVFARPGVCHRWEVDRAELNNALEHLHTVATMVAAGGRFVVADRIRLVGEPESG